jgi:para-nitrobenzyl esterase
MVWLHGGGFRIGSGERLTRGMLSRRNDVVVVTLNHRIDVFGMLHLAELCGPEYADSGNLTLLDLLQALQWVRENIERFGGDPNNVTLFGESGGGRKVSTLLAMPAARPLFRRGIVQSGAQLKVASCAGASAFSARVLEHLDLGPGQRHRVSDLPAERLLDASRAVLSRETGEGVLPVVDGRVLERHPFHPDAPAISADVPLIIGTNRDEMSFFLRAEDWSLDEAGVAQRVTQLVGAEHAPEVLRTFRELYPESMPASLLAKIQTARGYFLDAILLAERKAALSAAPTYAYQFDFASTLRGGRLGAHHALEVPFVFDELDAAALVVGSITPAMRELATLMSTTWVQFARTGDPNHAELPAWQPYATQDRTTLLFDTPLGFAQDPRSRERELMQRIGPAAPGQSPVV